MPTDTAVRQVEFDAALFLSAEHIKEYPLVFWNLDNSRWVKALNDTRQTVTLDCYCLGLVNPLTDDRFAAWDALEGALDEYLTALQRSDISIETAGIPKEYYAPGLLSVDGEVAVKYNLKIKLWC